jgi:hypothetical protein
MQFLSVSLCPGIEPPPVAVTEREHPLATALGSQRRITPNRIGSHLRSTYTTPRAEQLVMSAFFVKVLLAGTSARGVAWPGYCVRIVGEVEQSAAEGRDFAQLAERNPTECGVPTG